MQKMSWQFFLPKVSECLSVLQRSDSALVSDTVRILIQ